MALTKVIGSGVQGIANASDATFLTATSAEGVTLAGTLAVTGVHTIGNNAVVTSEGGAVTSNLPQGQCKAWVRTKTASVTVTDSFNMSSVTDSAVGRFAPQINNNMGNANYACVLGADDKQDGGSVFIHAINDAVDMATTGYGTSFKKFTYADADPNDNASSLVIGDLA